MYRCFVILIFIISTNLSAQDAYFNFGVGPDIPVKKAPNGYTVTRFRINVEIGSKNLSFVFQPAFGGGATSFFIGPRLMLPFQVGSQPLFIIPDFTIGADFGFSSGVVGIALDLKFGLRAFYEISEGIAISFRPFGLAVRPFNVWFGNTTNQRKISVYYELMFGFAHFF